MLLKHEYEYTWGPLPEDTETMELDQAVREMMGGMPELVRERLVVQTMRMRYPVRRPPHKGNSIVRPVQLAKRHRAGMVTHEVRFRMKTRGCIGRYLDMSRRRRRLADKGY